MSAKTADQLAADVRAGLNIGPLPASRSEREVLDLAADRLTELVSRLQTAEATIDKWVELGQQLDAQIIDLTRDRDGWKQNYEAAKARVSLAEGEIKTLSERLDTLTTALEEIMQLPGWPLPHKAIARRALADNGT